MRNKLLVGGGLVAALVVSALAVLLFVDFDSPRLGKAVLDQVSAQTGLKIEADGFRLNVVRGLRMEGVRVASESPGGRLTLQAKGFLAEHRLLPLLQGRVKIDRIVIYEPRIELVTAPKKALTRAALPKPDWKEKPSAAPAVNQESGAQAPSGPALAVDSIRLQGGTLATRTEGAPAPDVEIRGLDVDLRDLALDDAPTAIQGLRAVPPRVLDLVDDGGWVTVPLRVQGTPQSPSVTADGEALREMGGQAVRAVVRQQVEKGVSRLLGKLFGRR